MRKQERFWERISAIMKNCKLGMQPFWFWNGDMSEEEIVRQILEMKEKGIPGFMIHPRQGMEIPYMSKEFFDRVKLAVRTAKENDMEVWFYDEYPYPSGVCGGEVILEHPEYLCKKLEKQTAIVKGGQEVKLMAPWGRVVLARAYRMQGDTYSLEDFIDLQEYVGTGYKQEVFQYSGLTKYNKKRYFTGDAQKFLSWQAPEGTWKIYLVTEVVMKHFKYFENFIDTLNPDAIRYFIELTHERYKREIGEEFGKTVKGIFTDEITAFPDREPWSPLLPGKVKEKYGIDLVANLPALWENLGEISTKVRYAYWSTATDCFIDAYDKQVYEWCEKNHLLYIGEKPILRSKQLQYFHIPGIDAGHQKVGTVPNMIIGKYRANGKMVSSAAHFYDKPAALCEVGHSIGWGMTMQDLKWMFEWLAVLGVDWYVIHGFFFTADGLKKHDAPPSAFYQMPWWQDAAAITGKASALSRFLQEAEREIKILAIDPVSSAWTADREEETLLKDSFAKLQTKMMCNGLDYYIIDPELFAKGEVKTEKGKTLFSVHGESYEMLVLPPMTNLEEPACEKLLAYIKQGGKVCALSSVPFEAITDHSSAAEVPEQFGICAEEEWQRFCKGEAQTSKEKGELYFAGTIEDAVQWMQEKLSFQWKVTALDGLGKEQLPQFSGKIGKDPFLYLVNTSSQERKLEVTTPEGTVQVLTLEPYASEKIGCQPMEEQPAVEVDIEGEMPFETSSLNALRLGFWKVTLPDGQSAVLETAPLIDTLESGKFSYPVAQKNYFGCPKELAFTGAEAAYDLQINCKGILQQDKPVYLVMEPGTFLGDWEIQINGNSLGEADFIRKEIYAKTNLTTEVTKYLKEGKNLLTVKVKSEVSYGGFRNPLYLFGDFSVRKEGESWSLLPKEKTGRMENLRENGLPFYYGEVVYTKEIELAAPQGENTYFKVKADWLTDSVRLSTGGYETEACAWTPYCFKVPSRYLKAGKVQLQFHVKTTALGLYEGQEFDRKQHAYVNL